MEGPITYLKVRIPEKVRGEKGREKKKKGEQGNINGRNQSAPARGVINGIRITRY